MTSASVVEEVQRVVSNWAVSLWTLADDALL
jgi:hypothetical protein